MKRTISFVIMIALVISFITSCGTDNKNTSTNNTYSYWVSLDTSVAQTLKSFNDLMMYREMIKRTGVDVKFIHPASGTTGSEAFQILMSSGDYPDMIEYSWSNYTGGPDQAINDGVIISLNEYMEEYAPNYYYYMEGKGGREKNYSYKASSISNDGNYYGFKNLNVGAYKGYCGLYVRADLLEEWRLDIPTTIAEWENVFKTAKENGIKYPLTGDKNLMGALVSDCFNSAWKVGNGFYLEGNTVKFGPFEKEYKNYVEKMAEWVKSGYVDIDYITNDQTIVQGQITNGTSIASIGYVGGDLGAIIPAMAERDPEFDLVACPYPVMNKGESAIFQPIQADASDPCIAISVQCGAKNQDRYKNAIKFCDYLYSDEGLILKSFGVEGETFTVEKDKDGNEHYIYTDKVKNYEEFGATNMGAALFHFMLPANHPGFNQHPDYFNGFYAYERQNEAISVWNKYVDTASKHVFPKVSYTGDEASEKANIESLANDNLKARISNIILGKESINNYEQAINDAKKAGYNKLLKINQDAYNRYISVIQ